MTTAPTCTACGHQPRPPYRHGKFGKVCPACKHDTTGPDAVYCHECGAKLISVSDDKDK